MGKGPSGPKSDAEIEEEPTAEDVRDSVIWAVTAEHVEMAEFYFEDDGTVASYLQLLGNSYNLTNLSTERIERAQKLLEEWCSDREELSPETGASSSYMTIKIEATPEQHVRIVEKVLAEIYGRSASDITRITRSTAPLYVDPDREDYSELATNPQLVQERLDENDIEVGEGKMAGVIDLETDLNLDALYIGLGLEDLTYEPEAFPGVVYHQRTHPDAIIFKDGHMTIIGATSEDDIQNAISAIVETLLAVDLADSLDVDEDRVTTYAME